MDLGVANGVTFCCIASCGFDSVANRIANETPLPGSVVYLYAALKTLASWKPATFQLEVDGEQREVTGYSVIVGNSKAYGGGMFVAPGADLHDGLLQLVTIRKSPRLRFLALLPTVFKGKHIHAPEVSVSDARTVLVSADRSFTVYADGDPLCELPAEISVMPDAVRIVLAAGSNG